MVNWDWSERWVFYAESKDGIHWVKPKLGQVKYLGYDTNFISFPFDAKAHSNAIFRDPAARKEAERYKMLYMQERQGKVSMYPGYSSDGLNWKAYDVDRPAVPYWSDTNNNLLWDAKRKRYVLYLRTFNKLNRWMDPGPIYPEDARTPDGLIRHQCRFPQLGQPSRHQGRGRPIPQLSRRRKGPGRES